MNTHSLSQKNNFPLLPEFQKSIQEQVDEMRNLSKQEEMMDVGGGNTGQIAKNSPQDPAIAPQLYEDPPGGEAG